MAVNEINLFRESGQGDTPNDILTPALLRQLQAKQTLAQRALMLGTSTEPVYSHAQGLARVLQAGIGGWLEHDEREKMQKNMAAANKFGAGLLDDNSPSPGGAYPSSGSPSSGGAKTMPAGTTGRRAGDPAIENEFMSTVSGGMTNPFGLATVHSYGNSESGWSPTNVSGSWNDVGDTAGGALSWRGPRYDNMRSFAAEQGDEGNGRPSTQAQFFIKENPELIAKMEKATSLEEANRLMANAWRFKGYDRNDGEFANRLERSRGLLPRYQQKAEGEPDVARPALASRGDSMSDAVDDPAVTAAQPAQPRLTPGGAGIGYSEADAQRLEKAEVDALPPPLDLGGRIAAQAGRLPPNQGAPKSTPPDPTPDEALDARITEQATRLTPGQGAPPPEGSVPAEVAAPAVPRPSPAAPVASPRQPSPPRAVAAALRAPPPSAAPQPPPAPAPDIDTSGPDGGAGAFARAGMGRPPPQNNMLVDLLRGRTPEAPQQPLPQPPQTPPQGGQPPRAQYANQPASLPPRPVPAAPAGPAQPWAPASMNARQRAELDAAERRAGGGRQPPPPPASTATEPTTQEGRNAALTGGRPGTPAPAPAAAPAQPQLPVPPLNDETAKQVATTAHNMQIPPSTLRDPRVVKAIQYLNLPAEYQQDGYKVIAGNVLKNAMEPKASEPFEYQGGIARRTHDNKIIWDVPPKDATPMEGANGQKGFFDPRTRTWHPLSAGGDGGMFPGSGNEAIAANHLIKQGLLSKEQAADFIMGKSVTGADGATYFLTPTGVARKEREAQRAASAPASPAGAAAPAQQGGTPAAPQTPGITQVTPAKPDAFPEGQAKEAKFARRMEQAEIALKPVETQGSGNAIEQALSGIPLIGGSGYLHSKDFQKYQQAKSQFITGLLRDESGAAINDPEYKRYERELFPVPGEDPETTQQKRLARQSIIESRRSLGGGAYKALPPMPKAEERGSPKEESDVMKELRRRGLI